MKLITNKDRENARMVYLMSQMLRKSLAWKKEKIKFSEEIEFTSEYLELQSRLVEGNLHFKLVCQEELKSYCVLKFILQPLVVKCYLNIIIFIQDKNSMFGLEQAGKSRIINRS